MVAGITLGNLLGGKLMKSSRRKLAMTIIVLEFISVIPTLFLNVYLICFGRFSLGICSGILIVTGPRMVEETVPHQ